MPATLASTILLISVVYAARHMPVIRWCQSALQLSVQVGTPRDEPPSPSTARGVIYVIELY